MKIFFSSVDHVALASAWKMESARLARVPGVFFSSNRRDLDLEVDRTQLSLEVGEIQLSLEVDRTQLSLKVD